ncbi:MAG: ketoacyl-ACP synthase III [Candidatus Obscuribacterales bacterium]|nr:ketoacyl-ACP synthase III [Candidatus Obscuribacterales bacterium]
MARAKVRSIGTALPEKVLSNFDLEKMVETSNDWIVERTGIHTRRIAEKGVTTSDLAADATRKALAAANVAPDDVDLIIVATITPDMLLPATACLVQDKLGCKKAWGFDMSIACSGFLYALQVGAQFIQTGAHKNVVVAGVDVMSSIIDYQDRQTCIIFGDGGGAAVLTAADSDVEVGFIDFIHEVDGSGGEYLCLPAGGSKRPASHETVDQRLHYVHQEGKVVFKYATRKMPELCVKLLERNGFTGEDVDVFIPHQANLRIITSAVDRLKMPMERVVVNIDEFGNTTAGTLPLAMESALKRGQMKKGDLVLMATVGAGFSAGAVLLRW